MEGPSELRPRRHPDEPGKKAFFYYRQKLTGSIPNLFNGKALSKST